MFVNIHLVKVIESFIDTLKADHTQLKTKLCKGSSALKKGIVQKNDVAYSLLHMVHPWMKIMMHFMKMINNVAYNFLAKRI